MALVKQDYTPSKTLYALDFTDIEVRQHPSSHPNVPDLTSWQVRAVWTKTVKGVTSLAYGYLHESFRLDTFPVVLPPDFLTEVDMRYGGTAEVKWDGTYAFAPSMPFRAIAEAVDKLDPMLAAIPQVPEGYEGWYIASKSAS